MSELRLGGHKKARLLLQPGFFRDPVGIRTPNLRIRSAMLYPVELQSRCRPTTQANRGAKIDRVSSPPNPRSEKLAQIRNPHRLGLGVATKLPVADADPPGQSSGWCRIGILSFDPQNLPCFRTSAGPPESFPTPEKQTRASSRNELFMFTSRECVATLGLPLLPFGC